MLPGIQPAPSAATYGAPSGRKLGPPRMLSASDVCVLGFSGKRVVGWPDLAARLIALSGDVSPNPGPVLRVLQINLNGWRSRQPALEQFLREHKVDVAVLQETKLSETAASPKSPGYVTLRQDRTVHRRRNPVPQGGLAILVRRGIMHDPSVAMAPLPGGSCLERQAVKIIWSRQEALTIVNLYRPPARNDQRDAAPYTNTWPTSPGTLTRPCRS